MSLVARHLEADGIPTVIVGSALDIVEHCAVPRYLHVDFPLGNPCGRPWDAPMQRRILMAALDLLAAASESRTTRMCDERFSEAGDERWRERYMQITDENRAELARRGAQLRVDRAARAQS